MLDQIMTPQMNASIHNLLSDLLQTVLIGVATAAGLGVKIWINRMNSSWKKTLAERFVKYAEAKIEGDTDKQKWVADQLSEKLKGRVTPDEVNHLIEEAFINMKAQLAQPEVTVNATATTVPVLTPPEVKP